MKKTWYIIMFGLITRIFIRLVIGLVNGSNHTSCVSLSKQKCIIQPTLINLHPNEYNQKLHYYPFAIKSDRCVGSCNTLNDFSNNLCVWNKTEELNLSLFNVITGINELKTLTNHISIYHANSNLDLMEGNGKCRYECKKRHVYEKYLASIVHN